MQYDVHAQKNAYKTEQTVRITFRNVSFTQNVEMNQFKDTVYLHCYLVQSCILKVQKALSLSFIYF